MGRKVRMRLRGKLHVRMLMCVVNGCTCVQAVGVFVLTCFKPVLNWELTYDIYFWKVRVSTPGLQQADAHTSLRLVTENAHGQVILGTWAWWYNSAVVNRRLRVLQVGGERACDFQHFENHLFWDHCESCEVVLYHLQPAVVPIAPK